jgi:hypothetical protein
MGVRQGVAMDSLKFHRGLPRPTLLRPTGGSPLKRPYTCRAGGLRPSSTLLDTHAVRLCLLAQRLAEVAHSLLKLAPYDPPTLGCKGLRTYMTEMLPLTDWSVEAVRPSINLVLRRLDRMFNKIYKATSLRFFVFCCFYRDTKLVNFGINSNQ